MKDYEQLELEGIEPKKVTEGKTYYEQLGISEDASKTEVKKAYFRLVKKYPPEKFPEEFKEYRKAYEILIDENARAQYDKLNKIPPKYKELYDFAHGAMEYGDYEAAIKALKEVVKENPDLQILNSLLGDIYLENGNSGNGVKIFESLVKLEPENASYQGKLARAYSLRGYTKKAISQFERSLKLDQDNMGNWLGLARIYADTNNEKKSWEVLKKGLERAAANDLDSLEMHIFAYVSCVKNAKAGNLGEHKESIEKAVKNDPAILDYILNEFLSGIAGIKNDKDGMKVMYQVLCFAQEMAPEKEDIKKMKKTLQLVIQMNEFQNDGNIPDCLIALTEKLLNDCKCAVCKIEKTFLKQELLVMQEDAGKVLRYLKSNYPEYYNLDKAFYEKVMNPKKLQRLQEDNYRLIMKLQKKYPKEFFMLMNSQDNMPDFEEDIDEDYDDDYFAPFSSYEPFVRTEAKIGRNDPCPCGSGKKYKKCCGTS